MAAHSVCHRVPCVRVCMGCRALEVLHLHGFSMAALLHAAERPDAPLRELLAAVAQTTGLRVLSMSAAKSAVRRPCTRAKQACQAGASGRALRVHEPPGSVSGSAPEHHFRMIRVMFSMCPKQFLHLLLGLFLAAHHIPRWQAPEQMRACA